MVKYRVSELARLLGVSDVAVRKRIKHGEFKTIQETFNNRKITFVCLNEKQVKDLGVNKISHKNSVEVSSTNPQNAELKELITSCFEKYESFYNDYLSQIRDLNEKNTMLATENTKLKAQLSSVISKYNSLAKRVNDSLARKNP